MEQDMLDLIAERDEYKRLYMTALHNVQVSVAHAEKLAAENKRLKESLKLWRMGE